MGTFFIFTLKAAICMAVFYLFYKLLLARETFHLFNRFGLLFVIVLSLILPFIKITLQQNSVINQSIVSVSEIINKYTTPTPAEAHPSLLPTLLIIIYVLGVVVCVIREIVSFLNLRRLLHEGTVETLAGDVKLVVIDRNVAPFSWFNYVVMSKEDANTNRKTILAHELAHIALHHTVDVALCNVLTILQWFNPAAWLLKRELQNIHEFEADRAVIHQGVDAKAYQLLLVRKSVGDRLFSMANNLDHRVLKRRIAMMMARKSNPYKMLKLLYVIPVAVLAVAAFANPHVVQVSEKVTTESNNVVNYVKELPKAQETPIMNSAQIKKDAVSEKMEESHVVGVDTAAEPLPEPDISASINNKESGEGKQDVITEQPPSFQGGAKDLNDYLGSHIRYPADALERHIQGGVSVWVTISETGKVLDVEIAHSTSKLLNAEAIRVVKSMPLWNPALQNGKPVQVKCGFQINFNFK